MSEVREIPPLTACCLHHAVLPPHPPFLTETTQGRRLAVQFRSTARYEPRERFGACPLADFAFCQPPGQISFICLVNRELHHSELNTKRVKRYA
jgi:hypothetical protein